MALFDSFPYLENDFIVIHKMDERDVDALEEISGNDNIYRYIPPFLYKKNRGNLLAAIRNLGGRDFDKKKWIVAGIFLKSDPVKLVGLAEMFDYKKRDNQLTIGYLINASYWNRGIASNVVELMIDYLIIAEKIKSLYAYVMPENIYSVKALIKNGFMKQPQQEEKTNWGGLEKVMVDVYTYSKA